jgi:PmbA protein
MTLLEPWFGVDHALSALDAGLARSTADQIEISAMSRVAQHTRFAGSRIHQAQTIVECQILVRAVVGTGSARVAVNDLSRVGRAVAEATGLARARDGAPGASTPYDVASPRHYERIAGLWCESTEEWDVVERSNLAGVIMSEAALSGGVVNGTFSTAATELAVVTSRGVRCHDVATEAGFTMTIRCGDASSYIGNLSRDARVLNVEDRALREIAATSGVKEIVPVPDGSHDVVFGTLAAGELVGFIPDFGFHASAVRAGIGLVAERQGELIANEAVSIADDARSNIGLPFPFDFEGSPKQSVDLINKGRVGGALSDLSLAAVTGGASTGHASIGREQSPEPASANLVMAEGDASEEDLIAGVERGLYVQRLWYNRLVDAETGTIVGTSRDACFLIEDGVRTKGLAGARFNESVIEALARTDGVGSDRVSQPIPNLWNSCITAPAIRVRGFRFGARTRNEETS